MQRECLRAPFGEAAPPSDGSADRALRAAAMMLPVSNPKSPKRRHHSSRKLSGKAICYGGFVLCNVAWFVYSLFSMGYSGRRSAHVPAAPSNGGHAASQHVGAPSHDPWKPGSMPGDSGKLFGGANQPSRFEGQETGMRLEGSLFKPSGIGGAPVNAVHGEHTVDAMVLCSLPCMSAASV